MFVVWVLLPLSWVFISSFKGRLEIYTSRRFFPVSPSLEAYRQIFGLRQFWTSLFNSGFISLTSTFLAVSLCVLAAYGFARYAKGWWKHLLLLTILVPRVVPRISLVVPLYDAVVAAGLLNTHNLAHHHIHGYRDSAWYLDTHWVLRVGSSRARGVRGD